MSFTFRQLEVFVEAAKDCNFRKTADRIGISQPSISNQLRALEKSLGQTLFLRKRGYAAALSGQGEALLEKAEAMLLERRALGGSGLSAANEPFALRVAAGPYLMDALIRPNLAEFHGRFPDVSLEFDAATPIRQMPDMVRSERLDVAFYTVGAPASGEDVLVIGRVACSIVGAPELVSKLTTDSRAISAAPFLLPPEASPATAWLMRTLAAVDVKPTRFPARSQFPDVLADLAIAGKGLTVLFDEQVAGHIAYGRLQRVPLDLDSGYRVMIRGPAAHHPRAAAPLEFLIGLLVGKPAPHLWAPSR